LKTVGPSEFTIPWKSRQWWRPVSSAYRDGEQMPDELCASVNRMPSAARRSRWGVGIFDRGLLAPRSP
jgi:hypothetical protein